MPKTAGWGPSRELVEQSVEDAVPYFGLGAAGASGVYLLNKLYEAKQRKLREQQKPDELVITVPARKVAGIPLSAILKGTALTATGASLVGGSYYYGTKPGDGAQAPAAPTSPVAPTTQTSGAPEVDYSTLEFGDEEGQRKALELVDKAKETGGKALDAGGKAKDSLGAWFQKKLDERQPRSGTDYAWDSLATIGPKVLAFGAGASLVGGAALIYQKMEEKKRLNQAKKEYSNLLAQTLDVNPKTAASQHFPSLEGFVHGISQLLEPAAQKTATGNLLSKFTGAPITLAAISMVLAHKFIYDRERAADQSYSVKKLAPPKSIRIQTEQQAALPSTAEAEVPELPAPGDSKDKESDKELEKAASIEEVGSAMLGDLIANEARDAAEAEANKPVDGVESADRIKPTTEKIDSNTYVINTAAGPVTVNADDPEALKLMEAQKARLTKIIGSVPAIVQ